MARQLSSFTGNTCIVGRGWASTYEILDNKQIKFGEPDWYGQGQDPYHNPGVSYYIDHTRTCAADMVVDFSKPLGPEVIPDGRFDLVILEFLPTSLFNGEHSTLANAARITRSGGSVEIHSGQDILRTLGAVMPQLGFDCTLGQHIRNTRWSGDMIRKYADSSFAEDSLLETVVVDKLVCNKH